MFATDGTDLEGIDLYTAIDRVVRAVGRMVVWVEAAAELRTISKSRWLRTLPKPDVPNTALPRPDSTSFWLGGIAEPHPFGAEPGEGLGRQDHQQIGDQQHHGREDGGPPGTVSGLAVSSLMETVVSQPQ